MTIPAYPLSWPTGWRRTPSEARTRARFGRASRGSGESWVAGCQLSISEALERVRAELERMGINPEDLVVSTNLELRLDGWPRSNQREPADPGVAVYWTDRYFRNEPPRCMAIDQYDRAADNLAAVAATLDAMRAIERHGGAAILERAFAGFVALPGVVTFDWRTILDPADPEGSYRRLRAKHHPDRGGNAEDFQKIQQAWDQYRGAAHG